MNVRRGTRSTGVATDAPAHPAPRCPPCAPAPSSPRRRSAGGPRTCWAPFASSRVAAVFRCRSDRKGRVEVCLHSKAIWRALVGLLSLGAGGPGQATKTQTQKFARLAFGPIGTMGGSRLRLLSLLAIVAFACADEWEPSSSPAQDTGEFSASDASGAAERMQQLAAEQSRRMAEDGDKWTGGKGAPKSQRRRKRKSWLTALGLGGGSDKDGNTQPCAPHRLSPPLRPHHLQYPCALARET